MIPIIFSDQYEVNIGAHVFPNQKYRLVLDRLREIHPDIPLFKPSPATQEDLLRVHTPSFLDDLRTLRWTEGTIRSELPLTHEIVNSYVLGAGGTILACDKAIDNRIAVHLGGGFHHAFSDRAEGFCYINDVAVAIRHLQKEKRIEKACVIDCDLHQGNGTAKIFEDDHSVFTFSIHQENLYPVKQNSDVDIGLPEFTKDDVYLEHLQNHIPRILDEERSDLVLYLAGADPFKEDQLGALRLTKEGLKKRDEYVLGECRKRKIPAVVTLAGGYAVNTDDTVEIHLNTCLASIELYESSNQQSTVSLTSK
jgi:acetoin utilization deacetylase AcuC-like enzyme